MALTSTLRLNVKPGVALFDPLAAEYESRRVSLINYLHPLILYFLFVRSCGCNLP